MALVQRFNQLPQTGVVSNATAPRPRPRHRPPPATSTTTTTPASASRYVGLTAGAAGARVRDLQRALAANGITVRGGADGLFGPATYAALRTYQRAHGLGDTGVVDARTARLLRLGVTATPSTPATGGFAAFGERGAARRRPATSLIAAGVAVRGAPTGCSAGDRHRGEPVPARPWAHRRAAASTPPRPERSDSPRARRPPHRRPRRVSPCRWRPSAATLLVHRHLAIRRAPAACTSEPTSAPPRARRCERSLPGGSATSISIAPDRCRATPSRPPPRTAPTSSTPTSAPSPEASAWAHRSPLDR